MTLIDKIYYAVENKRLAGKRPVSVTLSFKLCEDLVVEMKDSGREFSHIPLSDRYLHSVMMIRAKSRTFKGLRVNCKKKACRRFS